MQRNKKNYNRQNNNSIENKKQGNNRLENKKLENKKLENKIVESKKLENKVVEDQFVEETNELQIEGKNPIIEALRAGQQVDRILIAEGAKQVEDIKQLASEGGVKYQFVSRQKIEQLATTKVNQGVIAFLSSATYTDLDEWLAGLDMQKNPIVLMLAELQDPHNVGSIIRTAEAAGASSVIIAKHRAVGLTATVAKVSAGAIAHMPIIRVTNLAQTLQELKDKGFWVVGTDAKAEKNYYEIKYNMPTVLVIGSEGKGMGPLLEKKCDYLIKIPMLGQVTSLNASVAAGIMTYEIVKQRLETKV